MYHLFGGVSVFILGFMIQIVVWRLFPARRSYVSIAVIFTIVFTIVGIALFVTSYIDLTVTLKILLLSSSMFLAYMIVYTGIEADSPSCYILLSVEAAGANGMSKEGMAKALRSIDPVQNRVTGLLKGGQIKLVEGRYQITPRGAAMLRFFSAFRSLYTGKEFGG